jgi:hypothetical protein
MQTWIIFCLLLGLAGASLPLQARDSPAGQLAPPVSALQPESGKVFAAPASRGSILEQPAAPGISAYYFSMIESPQSNGWSLLFGALLTGGVIVHRLSVARCKGTWPSRHLNKPSCWIASLGSQ